MLSATNMTHPQLVQKHDHPVFVVFDERVYTLHVGFLFMGRDNCQISTRAFL